MPDQRLVRARATLPTGYVYRPPRPDPPIVVTDNGFTANVIEGESFDLDGEPDDDTPWGV